MSYTALAVVAVIGAAAADLLLLRTRLLLRAPFWRAYAILVVAQLLVNGILTGVPVVRYAPSTIVGLRVAFAPVEDLAFGWALVVLSLVLWVRVTGGRVGDSTSPR